MLGQRLEFFRFAVLFVVYLGLFLQQVVGEVGPGFPRTDVADIVQRLSERAQSHLKSPVKALLSCSCTRHACSSSHDEGLQCVTDLGDISMCGSCGKGFQVNRNGSYVRTPPGVDPLEMPSDVVESVCMHQGLDEVFNDFGLKGVKTWTYFGSSAGVMRIWPGKPRKRGMTDGSFDENLHNCRTYEPRLRPWYIAAVTTGPKDVVILLDTTESMRALSGRASRLSLMKDIVEKLMRYTNFADHLSVIPIGETVQPILSQYLQSASKSAKEHFLTAINALEAGGHSSISDAFSQAFDVLNKSSVAGRTSSCQKIIILFSAGHFCQDPIDGVCDELPANYANVDEVIEDGQSMLESVGKSKASIFTISIGRHAQNGVMRKISCAHAGTWAHYLDMDDPLTKLQGYLSTIASRWNGEDIVWSNFYEDDGGLGRMTTATRPIFSLNSTTAMKGRLVGVVGHDVLVSQLASSDLTYQGVLGKVTERLTSCYLKELGTCPMQVLRGEDGQCPGIRTSSQCYGMDSTGHVYYSGIQSLSHEDASKHCTDLGGYLVELNDEEEILLVSGMSKSKGSWIGLVMNGEDWMWMNKGNYLLEDNLNLWSPGYQNNNCTCAAIDRRGARENVVRTECSKNIHYICEFDSLDASSKVCDSETTLDAGSDYSNLVPSVLECLESYGEMESATDYISQQQQAREELRRLQSEPLCELGRMRQTEELLCCNDCEPLSANDDISEGATSGAYHYTLFVLKIKFFVLIIIAVLRLV